MNKKQAHNSGNRRIDSVNEEEQKLPWELPRFRNWISVGKVNQIVRKSMSDGLAEVGLDLPYYDILSAVYRYPGMTQRELAERLLVGRSNLSMLLPELERREWIKRKPDEHDKRLRRLFLTDAGNHQAARGLDVQVKLIEHMLDVLTEAECSELGNMMRRVGEHLIEHPFTHAESYVESCVALRCVASNSGLVNDLSKHLSKCQGGSYWFSTGCNRIALIEPDRRLPTTTEIVRGGHFDFWRLGIRR